MTRLLALIAFLAFGAFLLVLALEVPSLDLVIVILLTVVLVAYDFITSSGRRRD